MATSNRSETELRWQWVPFAALTGRELYAAIALRERIFVVEQRCVYLDADGLDPLCHHLLGWRGPALIACLRAFPPGVREPEARIGRVAVAPEERGRGLGFVLMREGIRRVEASFGPAPIRVNAQAYLRRFYEQLGFGVCGPEFDEDGIPHLPMRRGSENEPDGA